MKHTRVDADGRPVLEPSAFCRQRETIRAKYPECLVLYRLGDFFEAFDGDAQVMAAVLDIPMVGNRTGIIHGQAETAISELVAAGHRVLVAEQTGVAPNLAL